MASVIFIHGTGVREASYCAAWAMVSSGLKAAKPSLDIRKCIWGDKCGVTLHVNGASIPHYTTARAIGAPLSSDENIALWATLYDDPLFELRLFASHPAETAELPPGKIAPWMKLQNAFDKLLPSAAIEALLLKTGLTPFWAKAFDDVHSSAVCTSAIQTVAASAVEVRMAIARAIVADMTLLAREASLRGSDGEYAASVPAPNGSLRDEIVAEIVVALGGTERFAVREWIKNQFKGVALRMATRYLERKRGAISDATYPGAGDILLYQVRGQAIRDFIHAEIKASSDPVVLLAHSLGGIACVDLLVLEQIEKIKLLITVGSQAPFLYEIDALYSLRRTILFPYIFRGG